MINGNLVRGWTGDGSASRVPRWPAIWSALVFVLAVPGASFGQTSWKPAIGDWNTLENWTDGVPDAGSPTAFDAVIENNGTAQLVDPGASVHRLRVGRALGGGNLLVSGGGLEVTDDLILNFNGTDLASMTVELGGIVTVPETFVGYSGGGNSHFTITGAGSTVNATTSFTVGRAGFGTLTLADGGTLAIGNGTRPLLVDTVGGLGIVNIGNYGAAGVLQASAVAFGFSGRLEFNQTDNLTFATPITGPGAVNQSGPGTTTLSGTNSYTGYTNISQGTLAISADANLGTAPVAFDPVQLQLSGGTLRATEDVILADTRGMRFLGSGSTIEVDATKTLTYQKDLTLSAGTMTKTGAGTLSLPNLTIGGTESPALIVTGGGTLAVAAGSAIAYGNNEIGFATVSGPGTTWTTNTLDVGRNGTGTLEIVDGGTVTSNSGGWIGFDYDGIGFATVSGPGTTWTTNTLYVGGNGTGRLEIVDGGTVTSTSDSSITAAFDPSTATVRGAGSAWIVGGDLAVGLFGLEGTLNIEDHALVHVGDSLNINGGGIVNLSGGTLRFDRYNTQKAGVGTLNFNSGTIQLAGDRSVGTDAVIAELFGAAPSIPTGKGLTVEGTATLAKPVTLDGGTFTVGILVNGSNLLFNRGTLALTNQDLVIGSGGLFGDALTLADRNIAVTANTTIVPGASLLLQGGALSSYILTNNGSVTLDGVNSTLAGAVVFNSGVLRGDGRITAPVNNLVAGEIRGEPGKTLRFGGTSGTNEGRVTLQGGALQFSPNLTNAPSGIISGRGTLFFDGGLTNQGKMQFSGGPTDIYGNVSFTGGEGGGELINSGGANVVTFYGDVIHNGDEIRTSPTNTTVFFGAVTGAAPFTGTGAVRFEGSFMPGNSPAAVQFGGDVAFGSEATFAVEIAGTTPGSQYDQILIAGSASFAGTLDVDLIDLGGGAYVPSVGDQFVLATYASRTGTFNTLSLPPLAPGLDWSLGYESTLLTLSVSSTMLPGDINLDTTVDRRDVAQFTPHLGTAAGSSWTTGDFNGDFATSLTDLALLQRNFGRMGRPGADAPGSPGVAPVPEPASIVLLLVGSVAIGPLLRRATIRRRVSRLRPVQK